MLPTKIFSDLIRKPATGTNWTAIFGSATLVFTLAPLIFDSNLAWADSIYKLPFAEGTQGYISAGWNGDHDSHHGKDANYGYLGKYAIDIQGSFQVAAARGGTVIAAKGTGGYNCIEYNPVCDRSANYVVIKHDNGESTLYMHLANDSLLVKPGDIVSAGQPIGTSGNTGYATGVHLHFTVQKVPTGKDNAGGLIRNAESLSYRFADVPGDGIPRFGQTYTSGNQYKPFDRQQAENNIKQLYRELLAREADPNGLQTYVNALATDKTLDWVRQDLANSAEAKGKVNQVYQDVLDREGDANGIQGFIDALAKGAKLSDVRYAITHSDEATNKIKNIFQEVFNRDPDNNELSELTQILSQSQPETFTLKDIRQIVETAKAQNLSPKTVFIDVPSNQTFAKDIYDLLQDNVISGFGNGYFRPDWNVTRGQLAKFVSNGFGFTTNTSCGNFLDVDSSNTFYNHITTLKCEGVINGNNGYFAPDLSVTRGEAAKFIINALQKQNNDNKWTSSVPSNSAFKDVPNTHTFYKEIMGAYSAKIVEGFQPNAAYGQKTFMPESNLTRGEASKLINRGRSLLTSPSYSMTNVGLNQKQSLTPSVTKNGWKYFFGIPTGLWADPPTTYGFEFEALGDSLFTNLLDFPSGVAADNQFTVSVANQILGTFSPGQNVDFVSLLGGGTSAFTVTIASLLGNTNTPNDVPFQLAFNKDRGSFRMKEIEATDAEAVPEPSCILGTLLGLGFLKIRYRQKQKATVRETNNSTI